MVGLWLRPSKTLSHPLKSSTPVPWRAPRRRLRLENLGFRFGIFLFLLLRRREIGSRRFWRSCGRGLSFLIFDSCRCRRGHVRLCRCFFALRRFGDVRPWLACCARRLLTTRDFLQIPTGGHRTHVV